MWLDNAVLFQMQAQIEMLQNEIIQLWRHLRVSILLPLTLEMKLISLNLNVSDFN